MRLICERSYRFIDNITLITEVSLNRLRHIQTFLAALDQHFIRDINSLFTTVRSNKSMLHEFPSCAGSRRIATPHSPFRLLDRTRRGRKSQPP